MADHVNLRAITTTRPNEVTFTFTTHRPLRSVAVAGTFNYGPIGSEHNALPPFGTIIERER